MGNQIRIDIIPSTFASYFDRFSLCHEQDSQTCPDKVRSDRRPKDDRFIATRGELSEDAAVSLPLVEDAIY